MAKYLFLSGLIEMPAPGFFENAIIQEATLSGNYLGPVPKHINPLQEVNAKILSKDNAFSLISDYANENGYEFDDMILQWQNEMEQWQKMSPEKQALDLAKEMEEKENDVNENDTVNSEENTDDKNSDKKTDTNSDNGGNE
jgi:capsid protein